MAQRRFTSGILGTLLGSFISAGLLAVSLPACAQFFKTNQFGPSTVFINSLNGTGGTVTFVSNTPGASGTITVSSGGTIINSTGTIGTGTVTGVTGAVSGAIAGASGSVANIVNLAGSTSSFTNVNNSRGITGFTTVIQNINGINTSASEIASTSLITPVDQNQLQGNSIVTQLQSTLPPKMPGVKTDPNASQLQSLLPNLPATASNDNVVTFGEMVADLLRASGQTGFNPFNNGEPIAVLSMTDASPETKLTPSPGSTIKLVVQYTPTADGQIPDLLFRDPVTNSFVAVKGSSVNPNSMTIDKENGTIEVLLDDTSVPSIPQAISALPGPSPVAMEVASDKKPSNSEYLAVANDAGPISGYLTHDIKKGEVFILNDAASGFYYANNTCALTEGTLAPGLVAVCDNGSLLSQRESQVNVLNGRVLFAAASEPVNVRAPGAGIQIPNDASAMVEYNKAASMARIAVVSQRNQEPVTISTSIGRPLFVKPGRCLSVYQDLPILKQIKLFKPNKEEVPSKCMISKLEPFDPSKIQHANGSEKFCKAVQRAADQSSSDPDRLVHAAGVLNPPVRMLASEHTIFSMDRNSISLQTGMMYLHTAGDMALKTEVADLAAKSQSDLVISYNSGRERIDVLSGPGLINLSVQGRSCRLNPGQEVVASTQPFSQDVLFPSDGVARRCFQTGKSGETNLSTCDFEISSMLKKSTFLKCLRNPQNPIDGVLRERLIKTACAVTFVTSKRGQYFAR